MKSNSNLIIILPYIIGAALLWTVAFPVYSGGGIALFPTQSTLYLASERDSLEKGLEAANAISIGGEKEYENYSKISEDSKKKLAVIIPQTLDVPRVLNEISEIAKRAGVKLSNPDIEVKMKTADQTQIDGLGYYSMSFNAKSNYQPVKNFITMLESNLAFYNVKSVRFQENLDPEKPFTEYIITIEAYDLKK